MGGSRRSRIGPNPFQRTIRDHNLSRKIPLEGGPINPALPGPLKGVSRGILLSPGQGVEDVLVCASAAGNTMSASTAALGPLRLHP